MAYNFPNVWHCFITLNWTLISEQYTEFSLSIFKFKMFTRLNDIFEIRLKNRLLKSSWIWYFMYIIISYLSIIMRAIIPFQLWQCLLHVNVESLGAQKQLSRDCDYYLLIWATILLSRTRHAIFSSVKYYWYEFSHRAFSVAEAAPWRWHKSFLSPSTGKAKYEVQNIRCS